MKKKGKTVLLVDVFDLVSQAEAAQLRGVTRAAISDLIKRHKLRSLAVAGRTLVFRSEVESYQPDAPGRPRKNKK